ncbi:hypothetical protein OG787_07030 [Streptomyces sp. NBC_00075]|uniref:DUF6879 family protein n=1 Tax=Streptomyces sp. NBC_00075 TaxID=2975641 RepID=UPI00324B3BDF
MSNRLAVLSRLLVTLMAGGLAYVVTNLYDMPGAWRATLAVVIASAVLIIQYVVDMERRIMALDQDLHDYHEKMRELVSGSFASINEATRLFGMVEGSALRTDEVTRLARGATQVGAGGPDLMRTFARAEMDRLASLMEDMNQGIVDHDGEDHEWLVTLTQCAVSSIDAVSPAADRGFWTTTTGRRYLWAQREAIQTRGVRIRRIFLVATSDEVDADLELQRESHQNLGIEVRVLAVSDLPATTNRGPSSDFIVFDDSLTYEVGLDLDGRNARTTLNLRADRVAERRERFTEFWEAAQ